MQSQLKKPMTEFHDHFKAKFSMRNRLQLLTTRETHVIPLCF